MLCFRPCTALLLATACLFLSPAVSAERATSCDSGNSVHRLSCDIGVISVQESLYGSEDSYQGVMRKQKLGCDGKKVCELITASDIRILDPCPGILKYVDTNYTCLPALTHVACQQSLARLHCDQGQVIVVYGADYGRRDRTTCINGRPDSQLQNVSCSKPTNIVATRCNGKNTCDIRALNSVFGDPCPDIYKYLEVAYRCKYPSVTDS
ncbi:L-rhamnose-binding lectin SML-like [Salarias fasciatus]|uniref:L-rhamnose-binding lectin SML-like n=1 Tax=Salarias fasciatus TaxID=181472 RepID=UPI001176E188|nr:L-rhamnose-binding lectin SML-like [Salarias fasciatus]